MSLSPNLFTADSYMANFLSAFRREETKANYLIKLRHFLEHAGLSAIGKTTSAKMPVSAFMVPPF